ncbi:hypothetical protein EON83_21080 [bacterium]|nr:MAG: hypothetical protein EON83_21080 [bacterium]
MDEEKDDAPTYKCQRCGRNRKGQETLCSDCQMRDFIETLDPEKLGRVREIMREGTMTLAVVEARKQLVSSLSEAYDLVLFLDAQEKANRPTPDTEN